MAPLDGTPLPYAERKIGKPVCIRQSALRRDRGTAARESRHSRMTAYDLNAGDIAWQVPRVRGRKRVRSHPAWRCDLPALGGPWFTWRTADHETLLVCGLIPAVGGSDTGAKLIATRRPVPHWASGGAARLAARDAMTYLAGGKQCGVDAAETDRWLP